VDNLLTRILVAPPDGFFFNIIDEAVLFDGFRSTIGKPPLLGGVTTNFPLAPAFCDANLAVGVAATVVACLLDAADRVPLLLFLSCKAKFSNKFPEVVTLLSVVVVFFVASPRCAAAASTCLVNSAL
jgi:hypothetical protein